MRLFPWISLFVSAALIVPPQVNAQDMPAVALTMKDLVRNGSFGAALDGWMTEGESMGIGFENNGARIKLRAPRSSVSGPRTIYQNLSKGVPAGHTLYLRFIASGDVRIGVQLREIKNEARKLIVASVARPGDDVTGAPKQYAYAVKADRRYGPDELQLMFSFGNDPGQVLLSKIEIYDQDFTPVASLPQTGASRPSHPSTPTRPVASPLPSLGTPKPAVTPEPAVENNVNFLRQPATPVAPVPAPVLGPPVSLIENGNFADGDQNWNAWGQNVDAGMENGILTLKLNNPDGSKPWDAGMSQVIKQTIKQGDTVTARLNVKGTVRVVVHIQEPKAPYRTLISRTFQAKPEGEEVLLVGRADADWNSGDLQFEVQMGEDKGELQLSNIQITKQSP